MKQPKYNKFLDKEFPEMYKNYLNDVLEEIKNFDIRVKSVSKFQEDDKDISYYLTTGETAANTYIIEYGDHSLDNSGNDVWNNLKVVNITIPKLINNVLIIGGKIRIPINKLTKDPSIRFTYGMFQINPTFKYYYQTDELSLHDGVNKIRVGLKDFDSLDPSLRTLTTYESKKFCIKLDLPTKIPVILDSKLLSLVKDKMEGYDDFYDDNVVDKNVETLQSGLVSHLFATKTRKDLKFSILRNSRHRKLYASYLDTNLDKFFTARSNSVDLVQNPHKINSFNFESNISRIYLDREGSERTDYNKSLSDLIDPIRTPDNANANRINELNYCTIVKKNGRFAIRVYDSNGKIKVVDYIDYFDSEVLKSKYYDYIKNNILMDDKGEVEVKRRGKSYRKKFTDLDLSTLIIDAKDDDKLSPSTRNIPMINHNDSLRIAMADQMINQAVELENPERPFVTSGNKTMKVSPLDINATKSGKVEGIFGNKIIVLNNDGTTTEYTYPSIQTQYNLNIKRIPKVKVGDSIKKGKTLAGPRIHDTEYKLGRNSLVAFTYGGYTIEDGVMASSAIIDDFRHISEIEIEYEITENTYIDRIVPLGTKLLANDVIVGANKLTMTPAMDKFSKEFKNKNKFIGPTSVDGSFKCPKDLFESYLTDVKVFRVKDSKYIDSNEGIINHYMLNHSKMRGDVMRNVPISEDYLRTELDDSYESTPKNTSQYVIKVRLLSINRLKEGDKITNRYGSKGLNAIIVPEKDMPTLEDGRRVEFLMNPDSTVARKIVSQLLEIQLNKLSVAIYNDVNTKIFHSENFESVRNLLADIIDPNLIKYDYQKLLKYHAESPGRYRVVTGSFSKDLTKKVIKYSRDYNLSLDGEYLYYNDRKTDNPVIVGYMFMMKLYHLPEFSNKVTSDDMKGSTPVLGGRFRPTGQSIGEMELWAYASNNLLELIDEWKEDNKELDESILLTELMLMGYKLED